MTAEEVIDQFEIQMEPLDTPARNVRSSLRYRFLWVIPFDMPDGSHRFMARSLEEDFVSPIGAQEYFDLLVRQIAREQGVTLTEGKQYAE